MKLFCISIGIYGMIMLTHADTIIGRMVQGGSGAIAGLLLYEIWLWLMRSKTKSLD